MTLHGLIIYNGFLPNDSFVDLANMLANAAHAAGHQISIKKNDDLLNTLDKRLPVDSFDYVLFTDKDLYLARALERAGVAVFNSAQSIEIADDKIRTYEVLTEKGLPIPKTVIAPKTFGYSLTDRRAFLSRITEYFHYPFIIKEAFGSFGEQVYFIRHEKDLEACLKRLNGAAFVIQEFIQESYGKDIRIQVVGDRVVAAMKRQSSHDFRANVSSGAGMEAYEPNRFEEELAIQAAKAIGADFAGVDLLFGEGDRRYVCEVNSNAHIRNLLQASKINVAPYIIEHIESMLQTRNRWG